VLFNYLSSITKDHNLAWDCATGSGQSAIRLAQHFNKVIATDASETQIKHTQKQEGISYSVARAENSGIKARSLDLITVAQALHWFDITAFTSEVDRTLKEGGILAVWSYNLLTLQADIDEQVNYLYSKVLNKYWPAERRLVEQGYKTINFPYDELTTPRFSMSLNWSFAQLINYLSTWSAVKIYLSENKSNPIEIVQNKMLKLWGNPDTELTVNWPLTVRVWQKS
jgi:ubiquinone/menaquinone biosynthesis C-methylase UbiE